MKILDKNRKNPDATEQPGKADRIRQSGRALLLVFLVWAVVLVMLRSALHIGSPLVAFIIMFGLLFLGLAIYRYSFMRIRRWWQNFRPRLVRFLARFYR